ncbi:MULTISPECIES: hypothetical protein [Bacillales]|uniref:Membrane protein YszA n=1 Tax=Lysinibacillus louembei TaxID=1470088 RepID=A0ABZ0RUZ0_9BACI|nr:MULTISPECIES: hypothetical protein [Bacillales]MCT6925459.1 hypothetical protein [Metasolibacillus sp.]MCT6941715.1 hypothetical protein [Metasolibacillus sp.]WPK10793.1 hypothetical protein R6U77_12975 [Lysinibacillus louembei]
MRRKNYNPYLLPPWLRKTRFYCRTIILPIVIFQGVRVFIVPTTGDLILLAILGLLAYLLLTDWI